MILYLPARYSEDSVTLWRAATAKGWQVERLHNWKVPDHLRETPAVPYGETLFVQHVAETLGLSLEQPSYDWLPNLPKRCRHRDIRDLTLAEARLLDGPIFLKPADGKDFEAKVYAAGSELNESDWLDPELKVLAAEPVIWKDEYRCFVLERTVRACSVYSRSGELAEGDDGQWRASDEELAHARGFAQQVLDDPEISVPTAVVVDVGTLEDGRWAVVEANPVWSSGIYGCDPVEVLRVLAGSIAH